MGTRPASSRLSPVAAKIRIEDADRLEGSLSAGNCRPAYRWNSSWRKSRSLEARRGTSDETYPRLHLVTSDPGGEAGRIWLQRSSGQAHENVECREAEVVGKESWIFLSCFLIAAGAGFASLFRSRQLMTARMIVSSTLYSGAVGLVIGLLSFNYFTSSEDGVWTLLGICGLSGLAGLGGISVVDQLVRYITAGGLSIRIHVEKDDDADDDDTSGSVH